MNKKLTIKKITINLLTRTESDYNKAKAEFIANYTEYDIGGFLSRPREVHRPDMGVAKWNEIHPNGFTSWVAKTIQLNAYGEQTLIDKINEIINYLNKK